MDVVVLAGGRCNDELFELTGSELRAEVRVAGMSLIDRVLTAVAPLGRPIVVGGSEGLDGRVEGGENFCQSLANGLAHVTSAKFLLVTVDLPCLTTESLQDFIAKCDDTAGLNFPIVALADCVREFPGMKRTTLKLREGEFTGGNVAVMDTDMMRRALPVMERAYSVRKQPLKLAMMVGFGVLVRVAIGQVVPATLPLAALENAVGKFLGIKVCGVVSRYAELGADLDKASDHMAFERRLAGTSQ